MVASSEHPKPRPSQYSLSVTVRLVTKSPADATTLTAGLGNMLTVEEGLRDLQELFRGAQLPPYSAFFRGAGGSLLAIQRSPDPLQYEVTSFSVKPTQCHEDLVSIVRPLLRQRGLGVELQYIGEVHEFPRKTSFLEEMRRLLFEEHLFIFIVVPAVVALVSSAAITYAPKSAGSVTFTAGLVILGAGVIYVVLLSLIRVRKGKRE